MDSTYGTAVIAGASSTLGMACADHLANAGFDLLLIDRDRRRLNSHANDLTTRTHCAVEVFEADLRHAAQVSLVMEKLCRDASISLIVRVSVLPDDTRCRDAFTHAVAGELESRGRGICIHQAALTFIAGTA